MSRRSIRNWIVLAAVMTLVAAACGDDSSGTTQGTSATTATTTSETTAAPSSTAAATTEAPASTTQPSAPTEGVTDDSITVSVVAGFTGLFGEVIEGIYVGGMETWVEDVNARGGVNGREVILKKVDHAETAEGGVAACQEVLSNGSYTAILVQGTGPQAAAADCLDDAGFANLVWTADAAFVDAWEHSYTIFPSEEQQGALLADFVVANAGADETIGVILLNVPVYTRIGNAFVDRAGEIGLNVVETATVEFGQASFTPQLIRMEEAGVTTVAMFVTNEAIQIATDASTIADFEPQFTGALFQFDFVTQAAPGVLDGADGLRISATVDTPEFAAFQALATQYERSSVLDGEAFLYYGYGLLLEEVLRQAGDNPTAESLVGGIQSISGYDTGVLPPITWGPGDLVGSDGMFPALCCSDINAWAGDGPATGDF